MEAEGTQDSRDGHRTVEGTERAPGGWDMLRVLVSPAADRGEQGWGIAAKRLSDFFTISLP